MAAYGLVSRTDGGVGGGDGGDGVGGAVARRGPNLATYAAVQSVAISCWAASSSILPAHTSAWSFFSSRSLSIEFHGSVESDCGHRLRGRFDPPNPKGIKWST